MSRPSLVGREAGIRIQALWIPRLHSFCGLLCLWLTLRNMENSELQATCLLGHLLPLNSQLSQCLVTNTVWSVLCTRPRPHFLRKLGLPPPWRLASLWLKAGSVVSRVQAGSRCSGPRLTVVFVPGVCAQHTWASSGLGTAETPGLLDLAVELGWRITNQHVDMQVNVIQSIKPGSGGQ